jgi:hypothetical protein
MLIGSCVFAELRIQGIFKKIGTTNKNTTETYYLYHHRSSSFIINFLKCGQIEKRKKKRILLIDTSRKKFVAV